MKISDHWTFIDANCMNSDLIEYKIDIIENLYLNRLKRNQCKWQKLASKAILNYFGWEIKKLVRKLLMELSFALWIIFSSTKKIISHAVTYSATYAITSEMLHAATIIVWSTVADSHAYSKLNVSEYFIEYTKDSSEPSWNICLVKY